MDWRELEAARRRAQPEIRGVGWVCDHFEHTPINERKSHVSSGIAHKHRFAINGDRRRGYRDVKAPGGVAWEGAA